MTTTNATKDTTQCNDRIHYLSTGWWSTTLPLKWSRSIGFVTFLSFFFHFYFYRSGIFPERLSSSRRYSKTIRNGCSWLLLLLYLDKDLFCLFWSQFEPSWFSEQSNDCTLLYSKCILHNCQSDCEDKHDHIPGGL